MTSSEEPTQPGADSDSAITIELVLRLHSEAVSDDEYLIEASSEGLAGGEESLIVILEAFLVTLKARNR
jgi:hypothetical protein